MHLTVTIIRSGSRNGSCYRLAGEIVHFWTITVTVPIVLPAGMELGPSNLQTDLGGN